MQPDKQVKSLPNNIEAEQSVLGVLLNNNEHLEKVIDFLRPEHFFVPMHEKIFELIIKFNERGSLANPITLKNHVDTNTFMGDIEIAGFEYLVKITASAQVVCDIENLARHIHELALRRRIISIAEEAIQDSHKDEVEVSTNDRIEDIEQKLFNLAMVGEREGKVVQLKAPLKSTIQKIKEAKDRGSTVSGVSSKLVELDKITSGFQNSDLVIIAARPSMGKTSLAINVAINATEFFEEERKRRNLLNMKSVGFVSLEMSADQIATRILSIKTGVDGSKIRTGSVNREEFEKLARESAILSDMNFFIDDTPALSISAIRTRARRMKRQQNLGLLIIDYLQLIRSSGFSRDMNRVQEIGEISQGLKAIAKELDIPVIALSQLSRAVEMRENKRPLLSDLRESGNIEQDADVVMFIYREQYYLERGAPADSGKNAEWQALYDKVKNTAEVIIAKQRNGPIGICTLRFDTTTTNFSSLDSLH
ncbi:MAG: replicative DNA helicase [Candidatus Midichloria sp.]|nr:replicative DNA helicase [Candidatus Midichloria sp.]